MGVALLAGGAAQAAGEIERSFRFPSGGLLEMNIDKGHVDIRTGSSDQVHVRVSASRGHLSDILDVSFREGDGLLIEAREVRGRDDDGGVEFVIDAPRWMNLRIDNGGGHIKIGDMEGEMWVKTGGGHISFKDVNGPVEINTGGGHIKGGLIGGNMSVSTGGGHIEVGEIQGNLEPKTGGGHISADDVDGNVTARSGGGHIELGAVYGDIEMDSGGGHLEAAACGGRFHGVTGGGEITLGDAAGYVLAHTGGGDIRVQLAQGNNAGADLESGHDGDIFVRVPSGVGFQVDARASGRVTADSVGFQGERRSDRLDGTIGGGGNRLKIRAQDGDVRIESR